MAKFSKTGSDSVTAAVRASRALTGKNEIAYCGGGGVWHDWFTVITSRSFGITKSQKNMIKTFEYNNIESLKSLLDNNNKLCHMNYYLCSSILKCNRNLDHKIKPINTCFEACNVNKYWIQNDFFARKTSIYSTNNININPIIIPILNFDDFTETKLKSRILTTVIFQ